MLTEPRKRHNGQLQACEPCRKAKIRCDHENPACSRCVRRGLNCVYHPAPMTKRRVPSSHTATRFDLTPPGGPMTTPVVNSEFHIPIATHDSSRTPAVPAEPGSVASSRMTTCSNRNASAREELGEHETTRFSAVFLENMNSLGPVVLETTKFSHALDREPGVATSTHLELAVRTLLNFPTARTCDILMEGIDQVYDVWLSPTHIRHCLNQVWTEYGAELGEHRTRESVLKMANDLFLNHTKPQSTPQCDIDCEYDRVEWANWFGGPDLRWEMLGILFSWFGIAFRCKQEWDPVFDLAEQHGRNRNTAADRMRECAAACMRMCEENFETSDIMVICMKNSSRLQSIIISDESDRVQVDYGTVRSAFISAGLHRLGTLEELTPFSQHRALLASSMYYQDKCHSLFNARPPMLNDRYCQCPLPLDLCEADVYGGRDRLAAALARLDPNGWNSDGRILTSTWLRALAMLSPIRESMLQLSLSVNLTFTKSQIEALISQLENTVESYPPHIQYYSNIAQPSKSNSSIHGQSAHDRYIVTRIHLDVLQCKFLLQRLIVSRGLGGGQDLFDIAQETISVIVSLWLNRDQIQSFHHAFDWIAVSYGMPCAGILCVELLRVSDLAPRTSRNQSSATAHDVVQLSRSEVVQSLIMFKALLDWIRPTDNNSKLSRKFKNVLQRIIDTVFDAMESLPGVQLQQAPNENHFRKDYGAQEHTSAEQNMSHVTDVQQHLDPELTTMNDMDWLNTVDWTQGDWLEQNNPPFLY
ncbi:uncharacterized protein N7511_006255 [Penicillium nucicola]|uniref:uncharacterized protein n=1 Tax=Penicillium nucicola TaxID=1850975 RepID=UPI00254520C1|nr:uncharacterized protein N7511_006255 [Penicillium nucicola]KAJ5757561.1 hypothetical protein N7511_006255 [Penicillium nucicola]